MTRQVSDREDLFEEAANLRRRLEIVADDAAYVVGYQRDGGLRCYRGQETMFGFSPAGELRRAFFDSTLYRSRNRQLELLTPQRDGNRLQFASEPLTSEETSQILSQASALLAQLADLLKDGHFEMRAHPPQEIQTLPQDILLTLQHWLQTPMRIGG